MKYIKFTVRQIGFSLQVFKLQIKSTINDINRIFIYHNEHFLNIFHNINNCLLERMIKLSKVQFVHYANYSCYLSD